MTREVVLRPAALADLKGLHDYIAKDSPANAARYVEAYCMALADFPERGTLRDDIMTGLRIVGFRRRVNIGFVVLPNQVEIVGVLYGGRDLAQAFEQD